MSSETSDILFARRGAAGIVTLNRPAALNAITHEMVRALARQLDAWAHDGAVTRVIVTAEGGRAFSAGGDIRALYELGRAGRKDEALEFFREEYTLNTAIKRYPKPYVSLIDGIVMGGGFGVSVHGSHRVAGDRFQFAMPEVGIGFFPDVGATWVLPRMPGETGAWCALTGERMKTADGVATGIATHHVRSDRFPDLLDALCGNVSVDALLAAFAEPAGEGPVMARRGVVDTLFAADRVEDILQNLDAEGGAETAWAHATAATMRQKSPTSLKIALAQVRRGRDWSFEECMQAEMRIVSRIVEGHDFYEGVRAAIVEKDNAPRWRPPSLADASGSEIDRHFSTITDELVLA
jgi:enoyl-CoA hydratase